MFCENFYIKKILSFNFRISILGKEKKQTEKKKKKVVVFVLN
jgi:hypothetical protein